MGGGGQSQTTQETKEVRLPAWVEQAGMDNYAFAQQIANKPYEAYAGPTVAGLTADWKTARSKLEGLNDYYGDYDAASNALKGVLGYDPDDIRQRAITAPTMKDVDVSTYLNPYITNVEQRTLANMGEQGQLQQRQIAADAAAKKAFGGSRQAIQQGVAGAKTIRAMGDKSAELRQAGFDQATKLAQTDLQRQYEAAKQTGDWQQAAEIESGRQDLQAHQQTIEGSAQLAKNADAAQAARMNEMASYLGFGQMQQEQTQREYDDKAAKWQKKHDYDLTRLNILLSTLGLTPYGHTESGTSTTRSKGGGGGLGEAMGLGKSLIGLLGAFASDRSLKTNVEKLGDIDGLPIYAYDYKADVKAGYRGPKRVGPMAQDVEKRLPGAVRKVGGKRVIDLSAFAEA
ncbi:MAG: tail fiber domain-containing protein [Microterricola sp.]